MSTSMRAGTAMVWGASGGIGRALVARLAAEDWTVLAVARHPDDDLSNLTPHVIKADVANLATMQEAVRTAMAISTQINLWIYAAGDITSIKVADMSDDVWQRILSANLTGAYLATHHSLPLLAADAHLVYLGAVSERLRLPGLSAYAAAKAGLEAFTEALRKEERKRRVTTVRPSAVDTPLWDKVPFKLPRHALEPDAVAERIVEAYHEEHTGTLNL